MRNFGINIFATYSNVLELLCNLFHSNQTELKSVGDTPPLEG